MGFTMLSENQFSRGRAHKGAIINGRVFARFYDRFTYESRARIIDVDVRADDGARTYHINGAPATKPNAIHLAIERRFDLC